MVYEKNIGAFFDLDLTITNCDTFRRFLYFLYIKNSRYSFLLPYIFFLCILRKTRLISLQTFKENCLICLKNKSQKQIFKIGQCFFESYGKKYIKKIIEKEIVQHKRQGNLVFIITAAPDIYINQFSGYLNCNGYESTRLLYDNHSFKGQFDGEDCIGVYKCDRIIKLAEEYNMDLDSSFAYSDNVSDLPVLKMVGTAVTVNPDIKLKKKAIENNWRILQ